MTKDENTEIRPRLNQRACELFLRDGLPFDEVGAILQAENPDVNFAELSGPMGASSNATDWAKGIVNFIRWRASVALFSYDKATNKFVHLYARPLYHVCDDACGACPK